MDRNTLILELRRALGEQYVIENSDALAPYGADWTTVVPTPPDVAVLPIDSEEVAAVVALANSAGLPVVARGAGTGLAGGARPYRGGMVVGTARMTDVLDVDTLNRTALVQPGLINFDLSQHLQPYGYFYAPDPASWKICTIGGNIANNSGGPHCLKYGVTSNHVLAVEMVTHDGRLIWTGDGLIDAAGYDVTGLVVGSEGTFGVVTRALVRIMRLPEANRVVLALFPTMVGAGAAVSAIVAAGYLPTSLEMMDRTTIYAVNTKNNYGLPETADAALLIEVDGVEDGLDGQLDAMIAICRGHGAIELQPARTSEEQERVWSARRSAFASFDVIAPAYYLVDTVVPRTRLPYMMEQVQRLSAEYNMPIANVFHAGDGNLHPLVLYDPQKPDEVERAHKITEEVLMLSIAQGGAVSGEHGIGVEKQNFLAAMYSEVDLQAMATLYAIFNPHDRLNPGKLFPVDMPPLELAARRRDRIAAATGDERRRTTDGGRTTEDERRRTTDGRRTTDDGRRGLIDETTNDERRTTNDGRRGLIDETTNDERRTMDDGRRGLIDELDHVVGSKRVLTGVATAPYSVQGRQPGCVVFPMNIEQVAATLAACHRAGATVVPWGGGTQQQTGAVSADPDVVVVLRGLAGIVHYDPEDMVICVGAGTTLAELQATLAEHNQMLPLEAPFPEQATLGGLVATAAEGPRRVGYGTLRDWLVGLTVVEVDGTVITCGGRVVKNVSGYDLVKLFHGSHGTLGVITQVTLRTLPRPTAASTLLATFPSRERVLALLDGLAVTALTPTAVEYLDRSALRVLGITGEYGLALRAEGIPAACNRHMRDIRALAEQHGAHEIIERDGVAEPDIWAAIAQLAATHELPPDQALLRLVVRPAELGVVLSELEDCVARHGGMLMTTNARALNGVIYTRAHISAERLHALQQELVARWQHSQVLACDPSARADLPVWGAPPLSVDLMQAIKQAFDPAGTLNPGRLL
jgi:glycolate oxidase subunit GlcD